VSSPPIHQTAAQGFSRAGAEYERGRPGYPAEAIELLGRELGLGPGRDVVDLAAGTGKLTRMLVAMGARTLAVEPVEGMREQLRSAVPGAEVLDGTAERLPLPDQSVDAVLVAQAFHWFDAPRAAREIFRVLKPPNGGLAVVWNAWDESVPWVARLQELVHAHAGDAPRHDTSTWPQELAATGLFTPLAEQIFPHLVSGDTTALLDRVASVSYIAAMDEPDRQRVLDQVAELVASDPRTKDLPELEMPYLTHVAWCHRASPS
jgi:ubiquinone/menaquinone biosynthesis C-methylase UbiE